jgi:hypothetical protein
VASPPESMHTSTFDPASATLRPTTPLLLASMVILHVQGRAGPSHSPMGAASYVPPSPPTRIVDGPYVPTTVHEPVHEPVQYTRMSVCPPSLTPPPPLPHLPPRTPPPRTSSTLPYTYHPPTHTHTHTVSRRFPYLHTALRVSDPDRCGGGVDGEDRRGGSSYTLLIGRHY